VNPVPVDPWKNVSEDELWSLAMSRNCPQQVREEAMQRWLFPAEYGYTWATERLIRLRQHCQENGTSRPESHNPHQKRNL
jgi:hypothetical protein